MPPKNQAYDRRCFLRSSSVAVAAAAIGAVGENSVATDAVTSGTRARPRIGAFIKFLQSLSYDQMAASLAEIGFDGIESTVRKNGHVLPDRVEEDLPKQYQAVKKHGMDILVMATNVTSVDQEHTEKVLRTAAGLGVKKYRMGYYHYDLKKDVLGQLKEIRPQLKDLAALNRELGLTAVYQNHSGPRYVGAPVWDLQYLLQDIPPQEIGVAFDIMHATAEGGMSWRIQHNLITPHIGAVYFKDFDWQGDDVWPRLVPLGEGRIDKDFVRMHFRSGVHCPISLHVEYLKREGVGVNLDALRKDLATLNRWLDDAWEDDSGRGQTTSRQG